MTWVGMRRSVGRRDAIAGAAVTAIAAAAVLFAVIGRGSDAAAQSSLTVNLPPAANDRIYASPIARGRPIVVIDAGHGGRDPGATSVSGQTHEKDLTLILARALRDELVKRGRVRVAMTRDDDRYLTLEDRAAVARRLDAAMSASADLAARLVSKAAGRVELRPNPHRFAAFHVLRRADAPAVLFEAGYLSNADDELLLRNPEQRAKMVLAIAQAIEAEVAAHARH